MDHPLNPSIGASMRVVPFSMCHDEPDPVSFRILPGQCSDELMLNPRDLESPQFPPGLLPDPQSPVSEEFPPGIILPDDPNQRPA